MKDQLRARIERALDAANMRDEIGENSEVIIEKVGRIAVILRDLEAADAYARYVSGDPVPLRSPMGKP